MIAWYALCSRVLHNNRVWYFHVVVVRPVEKKT